MSSALSIEVKRLREDASNAEQFELVKRLSDESPELHEAFRAKQLLLLIRPADEEVRASVFDLARKLASTHPLPLGKYPTGEQIDQGHPWLHPWQELARTLAHVQELVPARFLEIAKMWRVAGVIEEARQTAAQARRLTEQMTETNERFLAQVLEHDPAADMAETVQKLAELRRIATAVHEFEASLRR